MLFISMETALVDFLAQIIHKLNKIFFKGTGGTPGLFL
jgi:hypothetical protein